MMMSRLSLLALALGMLLPGLAAASTYERPKSFEPPARLQAPHVYRLVYIVDERGHWVLVRYDGTREVGAPQKQHRIRR